MAAHCSVLCMLLILLRVRAKSLQKLTGPAWSIETPPTLNLPIASLSHPLAYFLPTLLQPHSPPCGPAGKVPASGLLPLPFPLPGVLLHELFSRLSASPWIPSQVSLSQWDTLITPYLKLQTSSTPSELHLLSFRHFPIYLVIFLHILFFVVCLSLPPNL